MIDLDNLSVRRPVMHADLPAGGQRYLQPVSGYVATLVAGSRPGPTTSTPASAPVAWCGTR